MAVALDLGTEYPTTTTPHSGAASFSWSHGGAASNVKGVLVYTFTLLSATDHATSVTYGGSSLSRVTGGLATDTAGEPGVCATWFLGASVPQGTQTVVVNRTNDSVGMYGVCITVTGGRDTEAVGPVVVEENQGAAFDEQNVDDGSVSGTDSVRFAGVWYGGNNVPGAGANSTALQSIDPGAYNCSTVYETTAGIGSRPVGSSVGTDDCAFVALAVRETAPPASSYEEFYHRIAHRRGLATYRRM